jgi:hypothetical protein
MCRCVPEILRRSAWAAALGIALLAATPSQASLVLDFDLSSTTLAFGGLEVSNGMGATVSGSARIVLEGVDSRGVIIDRTAQGTLSGLDLTFNLNRPIVAGLDATLVGPIRISQIGIITGAFDGVNLRLPATGFTANLSTNVNCVGAQCPLISQVAMIMFPIVQNLNFSNPADQNFGLTGLATGQAMLQGLVMANNSGLAVSLNLRGTAPEPVEAGLLVLGVLALCGAAAVRGSRTA